MNSFTDAVAGEVSALKCDLAHEVLRSSGELRLGVTGWSMLPTIWPGDTVVIQRVGSGDVHAGDVVLFARRHRLFVHRVVAKIDNVAEGVVLTQGDGMPHPDEAVTTLELLGRVSSVLRDGRSFAPTRKLSFSESILAGLIRRFYWAARILTELHTMRKQERMAQCQN